MKPHQVSEPVHLLSIMGLFPSYEAADEGYKFLTDLGYDQNHIMVVLSEQNRDGIVSGKTPSQVRIDAQHGPEPSVPGVEKSTKALEGLEVGSSVGALAGAVALIGTSVLIPGIGLALGPLAAGLVGAGGGAAVGGLAGLLYGSGIPEKELPYYQSGIQEGKVLLGVTPHTLKDAEVISAKWEELGARLRPG